IGGCGRRPRGALLRLLPQLQPLVPGALEELLVLLLAHLLPALLDQGRQPIAFHSVPKRFRRSTRLMRYVSSRRTEPSLSALGASATGESSRSPPSSGTCSK